MAIEKPMSFSLDAARLAIIGLGYVGLPLAVEFGKTRSVVGFDINLTRVAELAAGDDSTLEVSNYELAEAENLIFTSDPAALSECNVFIVTVPTPIDDNKRPNLKPLLAASETIGQRLKAGDTVIYESTVYPGATEEDCIPVLEAVSGLVCNEDFFVGYSPERINPGDKAHRLTDIIKVTSGSTPAAADFVDLIYKSIITAGTYKARSIRVAEAAKVIENTQRDINIALVNELSIIFNKLNIDTRAVLEAAGTKWNFLPFKPGLVGGHCIGVDPYYLTHKAHSVGYHPEIIDAGRRLNDQMPAYVSGQIIKAMIKNKIPVNGSSALILGVTFKEDCPDIRNTKVVDLVLELEDFGVSVDVTDPIADGDLFKETYGINLIKRPERNSYDAVVIAVAHLEFKKLSADNICAYGKKNHIICDLKHVLPAEKSDYSM